MYMFDISIFQAFFYRDFNIQKDDIFDIVSDDWEVFWQKADIPPRCAFFSRAQRDELPISSSRMLFLRMNNEWFTTIAWRNSAEDAVLWVRRCTLEKIKSINQIHYCALSDWRHGAEWIQNWFFTLSCRCCFSMHFYGEPICWRVQ